MLKNTITIKAKQWADTENKIKITTINLRSNIRFIENWSKLIETHPNRKL